MANQNFKDFYGGQDPRDFPMYGVTESAALIDGMAPSTLREWCTRTTTPPIFKAAGQDPVTLSFNNLIEAQVLRALRVTHGVRLAAIREAIALAEQELDVTRLLLREDLRTDGLTLLLRKYGAVIELNRSQQISMRVVVESCLKRIDWDAEAFAKRFYPRISGLNDQRLVFVDPVVAFGNVVVSEKAISTKVIHSRVNAEESPRDIAADYGIDVEEIEAAVVFEEAA